MTDIVFLQIESSRRKGQIKSPIDEGISGWFNPVQTYRDPTPGEEHEHFWSPLHDIKVTAKIISERGTNNAT